MRIEIRAENEAVIEGYVNAVERDSRPLIRKNVSEKRFVERVAEGAFDRFLKQGKKILLKFNHSQVLGSNETGELELLEDNIGLYAKARVSDPTVITAAKMGKLTGWSFGFFSQAEHWEDIDENVSRRCLDDLNLTEVSILDVIPAYTATSIEMRERDETLEERVFIENAEDISILNTYEDNMINLKNKRAQIDILELI